MFWWTAWKMFRFFGKYLCRTAILFWRKYVVAAEKCVVVDLMEFAASEVAEVLGGTKRFESAANYVASQTFRKKICSGGKKMEVIPIKFTKPASRSRRDIFLSISPQSCRNFFGPYLLWQLLETLEWIVRVVDDFCYSTNKNFILLRQLMKTA